jgi:hypothetical protein
MKKLTFFYCLIFIFNFNIFGQTKNIEIEFSINDTMVNIDNSFDLFLVIIDTTNKIILKPNQVNKSFYINEKIDDFQGEKFYVLSYKGKNYIMQVSSFFFIGSKMKFEYKDKNLDIEKPFHQVYFSLDYGGERLFASYSKNIDIFFNAGKMMIDINLSRSQMIKILSIE